MVAIHNKSNPMMETLNRKDVSYIVRRTIAINKNEHANIIGSEEWDTAKNSDMGDKQSITKAHLLNGIYFIDK